MPTKAASLKDHLTKANEITITVTGRKSGRAISNPVWFVVEGNTLDLLPVQGSDTQWFKNALKNPKVQVEAGGSKADVQLTQITDPARVKSIVEKFRAKYGAGDVKKYYSKLDVALAAEIH